MTLADAALLDRNDPLAPCRERFSLPENALYLDGNSLGALPRAVPARMAQMVAEEWGRDLITSWNVHDWIDLPRRTGDKLAPLIGAEPGSVIVADSTSVNLFKLLAVALEKRPERRVILTERGNFPTDLYIAEGVARFTSCDVVAGDPNQVDERTAVVLVTEVNYRTGARHDMAALTRRAHAAGALTLWDLCHSAGAVPVDLAAAGADFAVGCGYKFLNGGPGAPAFAYVAPRHQDGLRQPLQGWLGHAAPFEFSPDYRPGKGVDALRAGTPPILSMAALDAALDAFAGVDMAAVKRKADALFDLFADEIGRRAPELEILTPRDAAQRGSQISLRHPEAYAVMQALIARGVIGDFRQPDIIRLGLTPLYLRYQDVYRAAEVLGDVIATRAWDRPEFKRRAKVV
ncbi:MAG: kynureninase [Devosia sp. 67-54]|uniref:kynureninase n=1 Tax=unclassified Devosia TaxID=196773 RepID=UPI00095F112C|nr:MULTISPECIES: kynureninase [unclassified Devosia]MBN9307598.1 kynureninase [Devosia sp.]OJX19977.1 MAG: kynureninase [Devosia sp. 67-54]